VLGHLGDLGLGQLGHAELFGEFLHPPGGHPEKV
jgi:hypothetical protein